MNLKFTGQTDIENHKLALMNTPEKERDAMTHDEQQEDTDRFVACLDTLFGKPA